MTGVAESQIQVPQDHLEARVNAVAALVELGAQAVSVHVVGQLVDQLVIHERLHVDILAVALDRVFEIGRRKGVLHLVNSIVDVLDLGRGQVLIVGRLVLEKDVAVGIDRGSRGADGMILGDVYRLIFSAHLHNIAACEGIALLAGVVQVEAVFAFGNGLAQDVHTIIDAVEIDLAQAALGRVFHPGTRHLKGQQVAYHAPVAVGRHEHPLVVLAHAQNVHLLLVIAHLQGLAQGTELIGFLGA